MRCKAKTRLAPHVRASRTLRRQGQALRALRGLDGIAAGARLHPLAAKERCFLHCCRPWGKTRVYGNLLFIENGVGEDRSGSRTASRKNGLRYDGSRRGQLFIAMWGEIRFLGSIQQAWCAFTASGVAPTGLEDIRSRGKSLPLTNKVPWLLQKILWTTRAKHMTYVMLNVVKPINAILPGESSA